MSTEKIDGADSSAGLEKSKLTPEEVAEEIQKYKPTIKDRKYLCAAACVYFFLALFVGVPVWWKTTEVSCNLCDGALTLRFLFYFFRSIALLCPA